MWNVKDCTGLIVLCGRTALISVRISAAYFWYMWLQLKDAISMSGWKSKGRRLFWESMSRLFSIAKFKGTKTPALLYTRLGSWPWSWCHGSGRWLEHLVGRGFWAFTFPVLVPVSCLNRAQTVASTIYRYGGISTSGQPIKCFGSLFDAPRVRELKLPSRQRRRHQTQRLYPCFDGWVHGTKIDFIGWSESGRNSCMATAEPQSDVEAGHVFGGHEWNFTLLEILEMPLPNKLAQTGGAGSERRRHRICGRCSREERWCWCPGMARHRAKLQGPGPGVFFARCCRN